MMPSDFEKICMIKYNNNFMDALIFYLFLFINPFTTCNLRENKVSLTTDTEYHLRFLVILKQRVFFSKKS